MSTATAHQAVEAAKDDQHGGEQDQCRGGGIAQAIGTDLFIKEDAEGAEIRVAEQADADQIAETEAGGEGQSGADLGPQHRPVDQAKAAKAGNAKLAAQSIVLGPRLVERWLQHG